MKDKANKNIITNLSARSPFAEAFRALRTNINFAGLDNPLRSILITSAGPNEGKSVVTCNLGVVLAQTNKKVLIVGCDLRRPTLHKVFDINEHVGVTNVLINELDPAELAQPTDVPGLSILASGPIPPNPSELVGSQRMKDLISRALEKFDYVLLDSPPINIVTDPIVMSTLVDGVIMVVKSGATRYENAREAQAKLEKVGANIIGVVLNSISMSSGDYYYHYYYTQENEGKKNSQRIASL
ncbi:MAG TPA: capsular biosynthesis protein [Desulfotomaculum sp.]|nr:MAG: capsular biosynthesis protein [Peptococcaceae bacterium BRH_c8a]KJS76706.1 MAG: capsular biosynthesis protein [Desulfotomaculum sp. BICA1-6]HBX22999.1 capsular biosynthesis protein [Desulfotomaculum sp.]